jgi:hypothetical protein
MPKLVSAFVTPARRGEFFDKLDALLNEFPEIESRMKRSYAEDPTDPYWTDDEEHQEFDPASPVVRTGIVLVLAHSNMQQWEDISWLDPLTQPHFMTKGLLATAMEGS